jgi:hypothetical protein
VFQPPRQAVLTARLAQPIRHQDEGRLGHVEPIPPRPAQLAEDPTELQLVPQMPGQQHRPEGQRLAAANPVVSNERPGGELAQRGQQVIESRQASGWVQPSEVGHDALGGSPVVAIRLDDLEVPVGLAGSFDGCDAWEHGRCLRALTGCQSLLSSIDILLCHILPQSQGENGTDVQNVVTTPDPLCREKPR